MSVILAVGVELDPDSTPHIIIIQVCGKNKEHFYTERLHEAAIRCMCAQCVFTKCNQGSGYILTGFADLQLA